MTWVVAVYYIVDILWLGSTRMIYLVMAFLWNFQIFQSNIRFNVLLFESPIGNSNEFICASFWTGLYINVAFFMFFWLFWKINLFQKNLFAQRFCCHTDPIYIKNGRQTETDRQWLPSRPCLKYSVEHLICFILNGFVYEARFIWYFD